VLKGTLLAQFKAQTQAKLEWEDPKAFKALQTKYTHQAIEYFELANSDLPGYANSDQIIKLHGASKKKNLQNPKKKGDGRSWFILATNNDQK